MGPTTLTVTSTQQTLSVTHIDAAVIQVATMGPQGPPGLIQAAAVTTKAANYTLNATDTVVLGDTSSSSITLTLPTAVGHLGAFIFIKKIAATNTITIATTASQTIDGNSSMALVAQYETLSAVSDGSNWYLV